jgi:hypothetical protein
LAIPISNHEDWKFQAPTIEKAIPISNHEDGKIKFRQSNWLYQYRIMTLDISSSDSRIGYAHI